MIGCLPTYHRKHVHEPLPPAPAEADKDSEITVVTENPPAKVEVKKKSRRSKSFFGILSLHGHSDKKTNTDDEGEINPKAAVQQQETGQSPPQTQLVRAESVGHVTEIVQPLSPSRSPSPPSIIEVGSACESSTSLSDFISDSIIYNSDGEEKEKEDPKFDADEAIDTKADEFIAQFYKQIEIQNTIPNDSGEFCRRC